MSQNYFITLKPLEPFFFGGEHTFGNDDSRGEKKESRYFAKSELFPQQSALLGMLRKAILNKKKIMTLHKKGEWVDSQKKKFESTNKNYQEATRLIGKGKFTYDAEFDIGVLKNISPVFICKNGENYFIDAKDREYTPKYSADTMIIKNNLQNIILFEGFNAKKPSETQLRSKNKSLKFDKLFKSTQTIGIKKSKDGKTEDDAFFMKESYLLKDKAEFAFIVQSDEDMCFLNKTLVTLGADQSSFMLHIKKCDEEFKELTKEIYPAKNGFNRIILLSETLLTAEAYALCNFIMGERKTMRHLEAIEKGQKWRKQHKSKRYYLFQRGTVIYTNELKALQKELNKPYLQKIGINQYTASKGESNA
jgi:CRISPR-associated protein Cmr3